SGENIPGHYQRVVLHLLFDFRIGSSAQTGLSRAVETLFSGIWKGGINQGSTRLDTKYLMENPSIVGWGYIVLWF
ncbi:hypothetical protein, partial [Marinobacter xestospongiae]